MNSTDKIYIAGHGGLVGSAILRLLQQKGFTNIITRSSGEMDLRNQEAVRIFFEKEKPQYVFLAAAKVGGIIANNTYPAEFIYDNLMMESNIIHESYRNGVSKLVFLGSSCIYPKLAPQPLKEEYLLSGYLEPTNEAYALSKIAGISLCQSYHRQYGCRFICVMPTNLYGPGDNYDLQNSHVLPALIRKFHEAKIKGEDKVTVWGSGSPRREFLHVDDLANACFFLMQEYEKPEIINIGLGKDYTIAELAAVIKEITGFTGDLVFDKSKPDGTPRKLLDVETINALGWKAAIELEDGIRAVYSDFVDRYQFYISDKSKVKSQN
ncbi:MAG TPA: GDP-L-fucose synthase [Chitinophagaceae bacterium]|nr:GDP-L-fucose synthase [Chitinophagaceae bacterium]